MDGAQVPDSWEERNGARQVDSNDHDVRVRQVDPIDSVTTLKACVSEHTMLSHDELSAYEAMQEKNDTTLRVDSANEALIRSQSCGIDFLRNKSSASWKSGHTIQSLPAFSEISMSSARESNGASMRTALDSTTQGSKGEAPLEQHVAWRQKMKLKLTKVRKKAASGGKKKG